MLVILFQIQDDQKLTKFDFFNSILAVAAFIMAITYMFENKKNNMYDKQTQFLLCKVNENVFC